MVPVPVARLYRALLEDARERNRILDESFESAEACSTDYDKVASAAWPLKVLVLKDEIERYRTRSQVLVSQASSIQNPISRVHALEQILGAIHGASNEVVESALNAFETACGKMKSWKVDLAIQRIAVCYFGFAPERMMALVSSMKYQRIQRQTLETMEITKANPPVPNWPNIGFENE